MDRGDKTIDERRRQQVERLYGPVHRDWRPPRTRLIKIAADRLERMPTPERRAALQRLRAARLARARSDPNAFIEYVMGDPGALPLRQAWFHEEWQAAIDEYCRVQIVAPRNSGKTTQVVGRAIWELGRDPDIRIKIVCATASMASERLMQIRRHLEENPRVKEVFPRLRPAARGRWTQSKLFVERASMGKDASVEALGISSSATGGRADLIIADDVVDRRNALQMPALRDSVKRAWFSDWTQLLEPEGRVIYICTLWQKDDLSHALMENPAYHVLFYAVGDELEAIWPEVWSRDRLQERRDEIGTIEFSRAYWNRPQDASEAPVHPAWIQYVDPAAIPLGDCYRLVSADLAVGESSESDYFALVDLAVDQERRKIYVVSAARRRIPFLKQVKAIKKVAVDRQAEVLIEEVGFQAAARQLLNEEESWLKVHRYKPRADKRLRVEGVTPYLERGDVLFSRDLEPMRLDGLEHGDLVSELLDFPIGKHEDMVDALVQGIDFLANRFLARSRSGATIKARVTTIPNVGSTPDSRGDRLDP